MYILYTIGHPKDEKAKLQKHTDKTFSVFSSPGSADFLVSFLALGGQPGLAVAGWGGGWNFMNLLTSKLNSGKKTKNTHYCRYSVNASSFEWHFKDAQVLMTGHLGIDHSNRCNFLMFYNTELNMNVSHILWIVKLSPLPVFLAKKL